MDAARSRRRAVARIAARCGAAARGRDGLPTLAPLIERVALNVVRGDFLLTIVIR
jgi:hypothetical protein